MNAVGALLGEIRRVARSRFARDAAVVAGGTAAAQLITVAFSPIITRLYGPEAFGILGVFVAMAAFVTPVATLAYAIAVVLPASDGEARSLVRLSVLTTFAAALCLLLLVLSIHDEIARVFGFTPAAAYVLLLPVVTLFSGLEQTLRQWLVRKRRFRAISSVAVAQATATGAAVTGVGLIAATGPVLIVLNASGRALHAVLLWLAVRTTLGGANEATQSAASRSGTRLVEVARAYRDFPLLRAPQLLLNATSQNIAPLLLAAFFGPVPAGFYALSRRVLALPSALVSQSLGTVLLPRLAEKAQRGIKLRPILVKSTLGLAVVGLVPFGVVVAFGPTLFAIVFGVEWATAGEYARWLAVWLYFGFMDVPCVQAVSILGLQGSLLVYEILATCTRVAAITVGATVLNSAVAGVAFFSVSGALLYAALIVWVIVRCDGASRLHLSGDDEGPLDAGLPESSE